MEFLIAYDIAHPRRLRRVARVLERRAARCQYSVFLFRGSEQELQNLLDELATLIRLSEDVVQAWPMPGGKRTDGYALGVVRPHRPAGVVVADGSPLIVPSPNPQRTYPETDR